MIKNKNKIDNGKAKSTFQVKDSEGNIKTINADEDTIILFQGDKLEHRVTQTHEGDDRIVASMVFCNYCSKKTNIFHGIYDRLVNAIFYGK